MSEQAAEYQPQEPESLIAARKTRDDVNARIEKLQQLHLSCQTQIENASPLANDAIRRYINGTTEDSPLHSISHHLAVLKAAEVVLKQLGEIRQELAFEYREAQSHYEREVRAWDDKNQELDDFAVFAIQVQTMRLKEGWDALRIARALDCGNIDRVKRALAINVNRYLED